MKELGRYEKSIDQYYIFYDYLPNYQYLFFLILAWIRIRNK